MKACISSLAAILAASAVFAQFPYTPAFQQVQYAPANQASPQPLHVRLDGPDGMTVTVYRRGPKGESFPAPAQLGLRPGYSYRFVLSGMKRFPGEVFYPTLEVRGGLLTSGKVSGRDFPATLLFTEDDFVKVKAGAVIKKVLFMERPELAFPQATEPHKPIEFTVLPNREPLLEAQERGQPLVIVYLGQRQVAAADLAATTFPGTVLLPGEKVLPPPRRAPWVPFTCFPLFDPRLGSGDTREEYSLRDGGDNLPSAGFNGAGQLRGVDPADTVAEYQDSKGRKRLAVSNRVSFFIPRFVVVKSEMVLASQATPIGLAGTQTVRGQLVMNGIQAALEHHLPTHVEAAQTRLKAGGTQSQLGTSVTGKVRGLEVYASLSGTTTLAGSIPPPAAAEPADGPLVIIKWPDKLGALVGDLITFYIRFRNKGGQPIHNVVVTDNLITRFEYVPNTTRADREVNFTYQANDVASALLRWEFPGPLLPGESGTVSFQVRIR